MTAVSLDGRILACVGMIAVSIGVYLPWLKTNPNLPPDAEIPAIYYAGMNAGFEGFDVALFGAVGLVLILRVTSLKKRVRSVFTFLTGVGTVVFCAFYLSGPSLTGFTATFVPALGWYLTVLGGVFLTVAGGRQVPSILRRSKPTATRTD